MNLLLDALAWLFSPANWESGARSPLPLQDRIGEHLFFTFIAVLIAVILAVQVAGSVAYSLTESVSVWKGFLFTLDTVATVGSDPTPLCRPTTTGVVVVSGVRKVG